MMKRCKSYYIFLNEASKRKKKTLRQLQSLCGSIAFCARALPAGRAFSRRLYVACDRARKPHHLIKITKAMQSDILRWKMFLTIFSGFSYILDDSWVSNLVLSFSQTVLWVFLKVVVFILTVNGHV